MFYDLTASNQLCGLNIFLGESDSGRDIAERIALCG